MNTSSDELIEQALAYGRAGNKNAARLKLSQVVSQEPENARAWYLLSQVVDKKEQGVFCLEKVLKLQPGNQQAIERLSSLALSSNTQEIITTQQKTSNKRKKPLSVAKIIFLVILGCFCIFPGIPLITSFFRGFSIPLLPIDKTKTVVVPTQTPRESFPPPIPGLTYTGIESHLREIGVMCEAIKPEPDAVSFSYSGSCSGISRDGLLRVDVDIYCGNRPEDIYLVLSTVTQFSEYPSDQIAADILGYIATIPYENAEPNQARAWVEKYLSSVTPDTLVGDQPVALSGGVMFHMSCFTKTMRCLAIGQGSGSLPIDYYRPFPTLSVDQLNSETYPTAIPVLPSSTSFVPIPIETPIPEPIILTGSDNGNVIIEKWDGPALIHITGSSSTSNFFYVKNDDGLFYASSFDVYDGVKILDFFPDQTTKSFEIKAGGKWTIEIYPFMGDFMEKRILEAPDKYQGNNDDVLFIEEGTYRIKVDGNSASDNFTIWAHDRYGEAYLINQDLLVNVIEPYKGTIDLPEWARILEIEAVGPWTIEITNR